MSRLPDRPLERTRLASADLSLQDIDDFEGATSEAARTLEPGGRLCLAIVHPFNSAGRFARDDATSPFVVDGSYLARSLYEDSLVRDGLEVTFASEHRPIRPTWTPSPTPGCSSSGSERPTCPTPQS